MKYLLQIYIFNLHYVTARHILNQISYKYSVVLLFFVVFFVFFVFVIHDIFYDICLISGYGAQFDNFYKPPTVDSNFSLLTAMIMLLVDTGIYLLVTWYVDSVMPGEYGVPEPWYFPFTVSRLHLLAL